MSACHISSDAVTHHLHDVCELQKHNKAAKAMKEQIHRMLKIEGADHLNVMQTSLIGPLSMHDRTNIDGFFKTHSLTSQQRLPLPVHIKQLLTFQELQKKADQNPMEPVAGFTFLDEMQNISLSTDLNTPFVVEKGRLIKLTYAIGPTHMETIEIEGQKIYSAFTERAEERKYFMKIIDSVHANKLHIYNTRLAAHKVHIIENIGRCKHVTFYLVQHAFTRKKKVCHSLAIIGINLQVEAEKAWLDISEPAECVICFDELKGKTQWQCTTCHNRIHESCMREWHAQGQSCPYCRSVITTV